MEMCKKEAQDWQKYHSPPGSIKFGDRGRGHTLHALSDLW